MIYKNNSMRLEMHSWKKDYAILKRLNDNTFIVVWDLKINPENNTCAWSQGYYDLTEKQAIKLLNEKTR